MDQQLDSRLGSCAPTARLTLLSTSLFCERRVSPSRANTTGWDVFVQAGCLHCLKDQRAAPLCSTAAELLLAVVCVGWLLLPDNAWEPQILQARERSRDSW